MRTRLAEWRGTLDDLAEEADLLVRAPERVLHRAAELGAPFSYDPQDQDLGVLAGDDEYMTLVRAKVSMAAIYHEDLLILDALAARVEAELAQAVTTYQR